MRATPLVSIALCTYNGESFLREQLESLLSQTHKNLEIIVVDDHSTDQTVTILTEFARVNPFVKLFVNELNLGYTANFEKALGLCSGEYIAICDQDDVWHPEKIRMQIEAMTYNNLIYHDSELIGENGASMNIKISDKFNFYKGANPEAFLFINCVSGHSILMKKSLIALALPFPKGFHYDQWLAFVASANGSIDFVDHCLVKYRQHDSNSTDLLAIKSRGQTKAATQKVNELKDETEWLKICADICQTNSSRLIQQLYQLSQIRNKSFFSIAYGLKIWQNRELLLPILKKNTISKFFFTMRKTWGIPAKRLF